MLSISLFHRNIRHTDVPLILFSLFHLTASILDFTHLLSESTLELLFLHRFRRGRLVVVLGEFRRPPCRFPRAESIEAFFISDLYP